MENGEWRMENGEWATLNEASRAYKFTIHHSQTFPEVKYQGSINLINKTRHYLPG